MTDEQTLTCPKCGNAMDDVQSGNITVGRCTGCGGLWVTPDARHKLIASPKKALDFDTGAEDVGESQDAITEIDCPQCGTRMRHVRDRAQKHITFERCPECDGIYLDAGEMADLAEFSMVERLKAFFGRE